MSESFHTSHHAEAGKCCSGHRIEELDKTGGGTRDLDLLLLVTLFQNQMHESVVAERNFINIRVDC